MYKYRDSNVLEMRDRARLYSSRLLLSAVVLIMLLSQVLELVRLCLLDSHIHQTRWYYRTGACETDEQDRLNMVELVNKTFRALRGHGVEPFLCYGTLWGALRHGALLPWDNNIDICVRASDLNQTASQALQSSFRSEHIAFSPYSRWYGHYKLELHTAVGYLTLFTDCTDWFYRSHSDEYANSPPPDLPEPQPAPQRWACPSGLYFRLFYRLDDVYHPFPMWLIDPPFDHVQLAGVTVNIPHDGIELQKYMYPNDWWLTTKPRGCK